MIGDLVYSNASHIDGKRERITMEELIEYFGNKASLARELGVSRTAVSQWCRQSKIPAAKCIEIEILTSGTFTATELWQK